MKIAIINDTHWGARSDSQIFLEYFTDFFREQFFPYLKENNINTVLHLGDLMDRRKFVNFNTLNTVRSEFMEPLLREGIVVHCILGNHDTFYKNTNDLNSLKELLGHFMNEINIVMEPTVMEYGSLRMALLPWICNDNYEKSMQFIRDCKADWLGAHLELNGFELMRGVESHGGMDAKLFEKFELVLTGHFHAASRRDNIWYLGSQMEFFWSDAHDPKHFHIIDTETREVEKIRNPHTLFEKIVYNDEEMDYNSYKTSHLANKFVKVVVVNKSDTFTFDRFIDRIQNEEVHDLKIAENFNEFIGSNVEDEGLQVDDTPKLMDDYIDGVDTDLDKDRIKIQMRELMTHAQALEIA